MRNTTCTVTTSPARMARRETNVTGLVLGRAQRIAFGSLVVLTLAACGNNGSTVGTATDKPATGAPSASLGDSLPDRIRASGEVKVGSGVGYPPMEFLAADDKTIQGVDVDLGNALGEKLGVKFTFINTTFDGLIPGLQAKRFDIIMSAMSDTIERQEQIDFVDYFTAGTAILVKKGNPEGIGGLDDLCGQTIAIEKGTVGVGIATMQSDQCVADGNAKITINELPKDTDALLQVKSDRAVADLTDLPVAAYTSQTSGGGDDFEVVEGQQYDVGPYGIGVGKDDTELRDAIQAALKAIIEDGTYDQVLETWDVTTGALTTAAINGATG